MYFRIMKPKEFPPKEILIKTDSKNLTRLNAIWKEDRNAAEQILGKAYEAIINTGVGKHELLTIEQAKAAAFALGESLLSDAYKLYIGPDVAEPREMFNGAELPDTVLDTPEAFRKEVLYRLRCVIGSHEDN